VIDWPRMLYDQLDLECKVINKKRLFTVYMSWVFNLGQSMHYIQAWKIYNTKSAEDISLVAYIICLILLVHWLIYGIVTKDRVIVMAETFGIIGSILVIIGTIIYS
jgi:MtN3 and saliva related transmembrane protein